eukprot:10146172-Heterocapsa_arctica.AAC.1
MAAREGRSGPAGERHAAAVADPTQGLEPTSAAATLASRAQAVELDCAVCARRIQTVQRGCAVRVCWLCAQ